MAQERLDFVVFGATGFTGKYVVEEIIKVSKSRRPLTFGVAGRSKQRLQNVLDEVEQKLKFDVKNIEVIEADASNDAQLAAMAKRARVVLNCCGPFRFYGDAVVKACVNNGANHVDISGEPQYMELMQLRYHKAAEDAGVYIVSACGLDSIPADMGLAFLEREFKGQLNSAETFMELFVEGEPQTPALIHYTTFESAVHGFAAINELRPLRQQLYPNRLPPLTPKLPARSAPHHNQIVNKWCIPFPGADRSVMQRTQRYLLESEKKRPVQIHTYVALPSLYATILTTFIGVIFSILALFEFGRKILLKHPKFFTAGTISHEGPTQQDAENSIFHVTLVGKGWSEPLAEPFDSHTTPPNKELVVRVTGRNPGYGATATMLVLSALTILDEADRIPGRGGVLAPGAAFGKTSMLSELDKAGIGLEVVSSSTPLEKVSHSYLSAFIMDLLNSGIY